MTPNGIAGGRPVPDRVAQDGRLLSGTGLSLDSVPGVDGLHSCARLWGRAAPPKPCAMVDESRPGGCGLYALCHVDHDKSARVLQKSDCLRRHPEAVSRVPESRARVAVGRIATPAFSIALLTDFTEPSGLDSTVSSASRTGGSCHGFRELLSPASLVLGHSRPRRVSAGAVVAVVGFAVDSIRVSLHRRAMTDKLPLTWLIRPLPRADREWLGPDAQDARRARARA